MPHHVPDRCANCYKLIISLCDGYKWVAQLPANKAQLIGMFRQKDVYKKLRKRMQAEAGEDPIKLATAEAQFNSLLDYKASNLLIELTRGAPYEGSDSPIPYDRRFKRNRAGYLCFSAMNILAMIYDAAYIVEGESKKRWLRGPTRAQARLAVDPGKLAIFRYDAQRKKFFLTCADNRQESHLPPQTIIGAFGVTHRPATLKFPEVIEAPAHFTFYLWTDPAVESEWLDTWLAQAAETGLGGARMVDGEGKFEYRGFAVADHIKQERLEILRAKALQQAKAGKPIAAEPEDESVEVVEDLRQETEPLFDSNLLIGF